jgi:hypothetical protein
MDIIVSSETLLDFQRTTRCYECAPEYRNIPHYRWENPTFLVLISTWLPTIISWQLCTTIRARTSLITFAYRLHSSRTIISNDVTSQEGGAWNGSVCTERKRQSLPRFTRADRNPLVVSTCCYPMTVKWVRLDIQYVFSSSIWCTFLIWLILYWICGFHICNYERL